ncbi:MAG: hypothetical protein H7Z12_07895 [Rhodospirillaceae bacterium]|nr:hypothetical protein [Rhodospirillales bacterium]
MTKKKRKVYIVDLARLTVPGSVPATVETCKSFFQKSAGGWAYRAFRMAICPVIENSSPTKSEIITKAMGSGPESCKRENGKVAGYFYDFFHRTEGFCHVFDAAFEHDEFTLVLNHLVAIQMEDSIRITLIQPRKNSCPENIHHIGLMAAAVRDLVVPNLSNYLPDDLVRKYDLNLPIFVEIFDTGKFSRKARDDRKPKLFKVSDFPIVSDAAFRVALSTFSEAFALLGELAPRPTRERKRPSKDDSPGLPF